MELLVSPTERGTVLAAARASTGILAIETIVSSQPERMGVDFAWYADEGAYAGQWFGAQRKTLVDYMASLEDGRLAREIAQMQHAVTFPTIILEGEERWTLTDSMTLGRRDVQWNRWHGSLLSLELEHGVHVFRTRDAHETGRLVATMLGWTMRAKHSGLQRPAAPGEWGKATSAEWAVHLLQGFEGIGHETARSMLRYFGYVPLSWDVDEVELRRVPGIGKTRAALLVNALNRKVTIK